MPALTELIPLQVIENSLDQVLAVDRLSGESLRPLLARCPDDVFGIALQAWHRLVQANPGKFNPEMFAAYVDEHDPRLVEAIEHVTGERLVREFGFLEATIQWNGHPFVAATSCAVWLSSGELHLQDILVADPRQPIPKRERKSVDHEYRGFGLLSPIMEALFLAARERHATMITLTAATRPLVTVFGRHGFVVEENPIARAAMRIGMGIPMEALF